MKFIKFLFIGILFGIVMTKSEAISWYRIQEMFRFDAFHMYGIIGTALAFGILIMQFIKRRELKNTEGEIIQLKDKNPATYRYFLGGIVFGLGWALSGACPGPMFTLVGNGYLPILIVIGSAVLGTLAYGILREILPH